ncbi:MAG: AAA family ATPase [Bdellovibrionaceae bacterium]|nr:AAA family ATPase [Pseudobdellovibrionaceae bacterium]
MSHALGGGAFSSSGEGKPTIADESYRDGIFKIRSFDWSLTAGRLTIIAGRPALGKTALVTSIARNVAINQGRRVFYQSLEMNKSQVMIRLLAQEARIPLSNLRLDRVPNDAWPRLFDSSQRLSSSRLIIGDSNDKDRRQLREVARDFDLIVIDYLQLMRSREKLASQTTELSEICRSLKQLAVSSSTSIILTCQIYRKSREDRRPELSDIQGAGDIEREADAVMLIYRDGYCRRRQSNFDFEVTVAKNKRGNVGTVNLAWHPELMLVENPRA